MNKQTNERAFETYVEEILTTKSGWDKGTSHRWDKSIAMFPDRVFAFLQRTEQKHWAEMRTLHGDSLARMVVEALCKELEIKGTLDVLRHGFKFYGKTFRIAYFKPAHTLAADVQELFHKNELTVTRQILCHPKDNSTVDIVLALNGIPLATIELKNPQTSQSWRHAIKQYQNDRQPSAPLFGFKTRSLVHFAADSEEVYMTTRLAKEKTFFLPLNRGSHPGKIKCGAGNPSHPSGYRTGYFWEDVLQRDSFLEIIGQFMFVEKKDEKVDDGKGGSKRRTIETMIFPRYHQLDAVRKLIANSRAEGTGHNYLIQHSAGSGKTNSISWLSHRLASLHTEQNKKSFDCVVVITDRQVLDSQLQDAVYQIEHAQGVVQAIDEDSKQLAEALVDGTKIVVTTLQKFPFVLKGLLKVAGAENTDNPDAESKSKAERWEAELAGRKYAIIVDEAHSSQSGESAREMKEILGAGAAVSEEDDGDSESMMNSVMASRGKQPNLSFFAFTATPKAKTLELFGRDGEDGKPEAFHTYSMRQAIEEGFILDVLRNYTTYKTYYRLVKANEEDKKLPKRKGAKAIGKFMTMHPHSIEQKIEVIIEHFRRSVRHHLGGRAKAMVVTSSRQLAVKYRLAFQRYIEEHGYDDIRALVAFSGKVQLPSDDDDYTGPDSSTYTEPQMNVDSNGNTISESQLREKFATNDYQVLLVANKYQTGFDQPLLMAMYVDKRLDGVQAVQTLSRLNRKIRGKEEPFVLDFFNDADDIFKAFKPYFDATNLQEKADPSQLYQMKHDLDAPQIYHRSEVEAFSKIFYKLPDRQRAKDHADLNRWVQPCVDRFKALSDDDDQKWTFREQLSNFVQLYSFLSQIMPYSDPDLERLYSFGKFVLPHLPTGRDDSVVSIKDDVSLAFYRLSRVWSGAIELREEGETYVKGPTDVGTGRATEDEVQLSELITLLNDRFGTEFKDEDRYFAKQFCEKAAKDARIILTAKANPLDKFQLGIKDMLSEFMIQSMGDNDEFVTKYMSDRKFQAAALPILAKAIFESVQAGEE